MVFLLLFIAAGVVSILAVLWRIEGHLHQLLVKAYNTPPMYDGEPRELHWREDPTGGPC